ncbi:tape measure protein [Halomonas sp. DP8Y7-3]|uniref:tape measure protein n=1 Tax=Halomonas sp. DP8Y7-3 TaxID=2859079 RepID=UPI001C93D486|nr:tape measure protein [Halomonas sp. DP8Y7-3]MBY5930465.1 tape measure protein [Halomonas sp. DP8Y7-3]
MADTVAQLKARLSYDIDFRNLKRFEKSLENANKNLEAYRKKLNDFQTKRVKNLDTEFKSLDKNLKNYSRHLRDVSFTEDRLARGMRDGNKSLERRSRIVTDMSYQMQRFQRFNRDFNAGMSHGRSGMPYHVEGGSTGANMHGRAAGIGATIGGAMRAMSGPAIGAAVVAAGAYMSNEQYQRFQRIESAFTSLEGSSEAAARRIEQISAISDYMGTNFIQSAEGYRDFANALKGSALESQSMRFFTQLQAYATATGASQERLGRIQLAASQVASTGKLMGDELLQFAEAGISRELIASSMGLSLKEFTDKQQSTRGILATELLPALFSVMGERSQIGGALDQRRNSTQAQQNRALNQAFFSNNLMNRVGLDNAMNNAYQGILSAIRKSEGLFEEIGEFADSMAPILKNRFEAFGNILASVGNVSDALDGVDFESPFRSLADVMNEVADYINSVADVIEIIRSDTAWRDKVSNIGDIVAGHLKDIAENFVNSIISSVNFILPKAFEIGHVNFGPQLSPNMMMLNPDVLESLNSKARETIAPMLNAQGGISDPNQVPFGPPIDRNGNPMNGTTNVYHQTISPTLEINGAQDVEAIKYEIGHYLDQVIRTTSMSQPKTER